MPDQCQKDGGFVGEGGCSHPHHVHSPIVRSILDAKTPAVMDAYDAATALHEGFRVTDADGRRCAFGETCYTHVVIHHTENDAKGRLERLQFAVDTVRTTRGIGVKGKPELIQYAKAYGQRGMLVIADRSGTVRRIFDILPMKERILRRRIGKGISQ